MKLAIMVANGSEEIETLIPLDLFRRANITVDLITVEAKKINILQNGLKITGDKILGEVNLSQYNAIYLPGGKGFATFKKTKKLLDNIIKFNLEKKWIFAICASPSILKELNILGTNKATVYPSFAAMMGENYSDKSIVISDNIATANGPGTTYKFALKIIELLLSKKDADKIISDTVFE